MERDQCTYLFIGQQDYSDVNEIQMGFNNLSVPSSVQVHLPAYELEFFIEFSGWIPINLVFLWLYLKICKIDNPG